MRRVAIVTDSASDLDAGMAAADGIALVPLIAIFGDEEYRAGQDMTPREFWARLTAPGAPFPRTAAASAGAFQQAFERCLADGAEAVVCVTVAGTLSATLKSAQMARDALPDRDIQVVDSWGATCGCSWSSTRSSTWCAAAGSDGAGRSSGPCCRSNRS